MDERQQPIAPSEIPEHIYCPQCAYHLRANASDRCPECGYSLENLRSCENGIPWVRRKEIGRFSSYWRTVWLVTFRTRAFCEEYARHVNYADAQRFRWVTILHAWIPAVLGTAALYWFGLPEFQLWANQFPWQASASPRIHEQAFNEVWPTALVLVFLLLWLVAATGLPGYFFHPRNIPTRFQNNAITMSYYACAPMALLPIILAMFFVIVTLISWDPRVALGFGLTDLDSALVMLGWLVCVIGPWVISWLTLLRLMRGTMPHLLRRRLLLAVGVPILWILLAGLFLGALPLCVLYVLVVFTSLG